MSVKLTPFTENEIAGLGGKWTHYAVIDATRGDLTQSTVSTDQVFTLFTPKDKDLIRHVGVVITEFFQQSGDTAYDDTKINVGDTNDDDLFIEPFQVNVNGTELSCKYDSGDGLPKTYDNTTTIYDIIVTVTNKSGEVINTLDKGRAVILFDMFRPPTGIKNRSTGNEIV